MQNERARPSPLYMEPLKSLPIVLISLFIVVAAVDVLLAMQPRLLQTLRAYWSAPAAGGTTSSALTAASLIVGGVALSATILAAFIRGVRSAPYLCITPVWVCACMVAIARVETPLPLPVATPVFVAISALLFVSSGVLFESASRSSNLIGTAASLLPLTLLSIGYAFNADAQANFGGDSMLMLFVLALAGAGAPAIAVACRANGARVLGGQFAVPDSTGAQIVALLERARLGEERAVQAERQLAAGGALQPEAASGNGPLLTLDDEELALTRPREMNGWFGWAAAAVVLVMTIAWYAFGYAPLRRELANAERANATQAEEYATALAGLRADYERKRTDLEQQLAAAAQPGQATAAQPAPFAPAPKAPRAVAVPSEAASDADAEDDVSDASAEREARAQARRDARIAKREQAAAERADRAAEHEANLAAAKEVRDTERQARVAELEQRAAERQAKAAERAEARAREREAKASEREAKASEREAKAAERDEARANEREAKASERDEARASEREAKTGEKVERSAAAAATAALEAEAYGADTAASKASKRPTEKAAPAPAAAPQKSAADVDDESSDDPLEGL